MKPPIDRALAKVEKDATSGCWNFTGALSAAGYGVIGAGRREDGLVLVHRLTYTAFVGPIPEGLHIDHLCRNRRCCNPDHLEAVTQAENNRRSVPYRQITHCKQGHAYTPENTYQTARQRYCKACRHQSYIRSKKKEVSR